MLDPILAHVELIKGNNVLGEVVSNVIICAKFTVERFFRCQQIRDLNIQLFAALVAYKVDFLVACSAGSHFIAPAQQFQIHDILQNEIDVPHIAAGRLIWLDVGQKAKTIRMTLPHPCKTPMGKVF